MKKLITLLLVSISVSSYSQTNYSEGLINEYYDKITKTSEYGNGHGVIKWGKDVKIYLEGDTASEEVKNEIDLILKDLNELVESIHISVVKNKNDANSFLFIGDFDSFKLKYGINNSGRFYGYAATFSSGSTIFKSVIFISNDISGVELKSVLREEITQSLGFTNDSWLYPDSIFYQGGNNDCKFSELDKKIIKRHYCQ